MRKDLASAEVGAKFWAPLAKIYARLRSATGVDFALYKQTTLKRRILRRMAVVQTEGLEDYAGYLKRHPAEAQALFSDALITVTRFFRDQDSIQVLVNRVFPALIHKRPPGAAIRLWVPGCSSGEEVYSLAISLVEFLGDRAAEYPVQIFGTDINAECIVRARAGIYGAEIARDVSPQRLRRFFEPAGGGYRIGKVIRDLCVFARHNLCADTPLSKMDLISCQNVLIYFGPELQKRVIPVFHFALQPHGFLLLGSSESVRGFRAFFTRADKRRRLYAKTSPRVRPEIIFPARTPGTDQASAPAPELVLPSVQRMAEPIVLRDHTLGWVIIDNKMRVLECLGRIGPYINHASAVGSRSLLERVPEAMVASLRAAISEALKHQDSVHKEIAWRNAGGRTDRLKLKVLPLKVPSLGEPFLLVLFEEDRMLDATRFETAGTTRAGADKFRQTAEAEILGLREELEAARESFQAVHEEQEATNEELKSANEEIQSSNEELQGLNQELEGAKEELESANEGLQRLAAIVQSSDDAIIGKDLKGVILTWNQGAERLFGYSADEAIGKPVGILIPPERYDEETKILHRIRCGQRIGHYETVRQRKDGSKIAISLSVSPIKDSSGKIIGASKIARDISERKLAEESLRAKEDQLQLITDASPVMLAHCSRDLSYRFVNRACADFLGRAPERIIGRPIIDIMGAEAFEAIRPHIESVLRGQPVDYEMEVPYKKAGRRFMHVSYRPEKDLDGNNVGWIAAINDITERKRGEEALRESEARFRNMADSAPVLIWMSGTDKLCTYFNKRWLEFTGRTLEQELGNGWAAGVHPDDLPRCLQIYVGCFDARREFEMEYRLKRHDGEYRWILDHGVPRLASADEFLGYIGSCVDITERKQAEERLRRAHDELELRVRERTLELVRTNEALRANEAKFRGFVESAPDAVVILDQRGEVLLVNSQTERLFGYPRGELHGRPLERLLPKRLRASHASNRQQYFADPQARPMAFGLDVFGRRQDGTEFPIEITLSPLRTEEETLFCAAIRDATSRKQMEMALRESEARLQAIMDNSPAMIFLKDRQGRYLHINRRFGQEFNLPLNDTIGKTDLQIFRRDQAEAFRANDRTVLRSGKAIMFDEIAMHDNGATRISIVTKFPLRDADGKVYAVGGIVTDVTERKRLEAEVLYISEREQRRIAQDLHDSLGQQLSGISMLSNGLKQDLAGKSLAEAATAERISRLLDSAVAQTRSLARGLFPVEPKPTGLMSALEDLASRITEMFRVSCRFECRQPVLINSNVTATHLFRIAQEAVSNAIKHGRAQGISIGLSSTPERIIVAVNDNGVGFKESASGRAGLGLRIMNYRAGVLGGTLVVKNNGGGGVEVVCTVESGRGRDTKTAEEK